MRRAQKCRLWRPQEGGIDRITFDYKANGLLERGASGNGPSTSYSYEGYDLTGMTVNAGAAANTKRAAIMAASERSEAQNGTADSFTYDPLNRIRTESGLNSKTYAYDERGNLLNVEGRELRGLSNADFTFDGLNRLTKVNTEDGKEVSYTYNGDGLLYERVEGTNRTRYYYDEEAKLIAEADASGPTPSVTYTYIYDLDGRLWSRVDQTSGEVQYYQLNGHGDVVGLTDSQGNQLNAYTYDIWGNPETEIESVPNVFRYSGEYWDNTTDLQYLRARWYDPNAGRFVSKDPYQGSIDNPLSLNRYSYVHNNPLTNVDPSGHDAVVLTNPDLAFGMGHTSALIENSQGEWYYFYWGNQNVQAVLIDDPDVLSSIDKLNEWGREKRLAGFGESGYISSTYIMGDFNKSVDKAKSLADLHPYSGKNEDYWVIGSSCLDITAQVLSLGTLYNGTSASRFLDGIWSDETTGDQIPNNAAKDFRSIFYNNAYTLSDYTKQLEKKYSKYDNMGWFISKINMANFHMYRINLLLGRKP